VTVPKAAVHKDYLAESGKNQIGPAGKVLSVEPKAETQPVDKPPHHQLGGGVLAADPAHALATFGLAQGVRQYFESLRI
jgi:hypothetical protein